MSAEHYNATFLPDGDTADDEVEEHHGPQRCAFSPDCAHGLCTMRGTGREGLGRVGSGGLTGSERERIDTGRLSNSVHLHSKVSNERYLVCN